MRSPRATRLAPAGRAGVAALSCLLALLALASPSRADFVPTHGALGPHLDPFVGGLPAAGAVGPPAAGGPGEIVPPGVPGVVWALPLTLPAADAVPDPVATWHWESEIDVLGLAGPVPVSFNGAVPVIITFGPGSDVYYHANQSDLAGSVYPTVTAGEVGPVWKQLVNLTPFVVAWGTSVTEDPGTLGFREALALQTPPGILPPLAPILGSANAIELSYDAMSGVLYFDEVLPPPPPEPPSVPALSRPGLAALGMLIAGVTAALLGRKAQLHGRRRSKR